MSYFLDQRGNERVGRIISAVALALVLILCLITAACNRVKVEPGWELVFNAKPMLLMWTGGISNAPLREGAEYTAPTTTTVSVFMQPMTFDEEFKDIMPKDNNPVDYHASVRLRITDSVAMVKNFDGSDTPSKGLPFWYVANIQRPFQTMNRQELRQYSMPQLALEQAVVNQVEQSLKAELTKYISELKRKDGKPGGLPVEVQDVTLGRISPQKEIIDAYNETGVQQQRAKTEDQRAAAELKRKNAETNRALADRAYQESMGLTADQYIRLQQIKMCGEKGGGCTVILNGAAQPMVSVK